MRGQKRGTHSGNYCNHGEGEDCGRTRRLGRLPAGLLAPMLALTLPLLLGQSCSSPTTPGADDSDDPQVLGYQPPDPWDEIPLDEVPDDGIDSIEPSATVTADAGPDQTVTVGAEVILAANGLITGDEQPGLSFRWEQVDGPTVDLIGAQTGIAKFTAPQVEVAASLSFVVLVSNGHSDATDTVTVYVEPLVSAGTDPIDVTIQVSFAEGTVPLTVIFTAATVNEQVLPEATYTWDFGDGSMATGKQVEHTYTVPATYMVTLCVALTGSLPGQLGCTQTQITARPSPVDTTPTDPDSSNHVAPVVSTQTASTVENRPVLLTLRGFAVDRADLTFSVVAGSGPFHGQLSELDNSANDTGTLTYTPTPGFIGLDSFNFEARTADLVSAPQTMYISVVPAIPSMSVTPQETLLASIIAGEFSAPPAAPYTITNTSLVILNWTATASVPWVTLDPPSGALEPGGSQEITAQVNAGAAELGSGTHSASLVFADATYPTVNVPRQLSLSVNERPIAKAGTAQVVNDLDNTGFELVTLDGGASTDDGDIVSYRWTEGAGELGGDVSIEAALAVGAHTITLTVTDNEGLTAQDTVVVTVNPGGPMEVSPSTELRAGFIAGSAVLPIGQIYVIENTGMSPLNWTASSDRSWANVSKQSGQLAGGATEAVTVSFDAGVQQLSVGVHRATITFTDTADSAHPASRPVTLTVHEDATPRPIVVLDIPETTATRMSPAPVFASIDFDASSTGDGFTWDQCLIQWSVSRAGGLSSWPAQYRYVADPRPGTDGALRDLATAGRGFNMGWLLTEGQWTITCTVTNPAHQVTTVTSPVITVAANTRTRFYVNSTTGADQTTRGQSAGSPYATLNYAFSRHGASNDIEYIVGGGHTEELGANLSARGTNAYVHWNGDGERPRLLWNADIGGTPSLVIVQAGAYHQLWEGIAFGDISGGVVTNTTRVRGIGVNESVCAIVDCVGLGTTTGDRLYMFVQCGGTDRKGLLMFKCKTQATRGYSLIYDSKKIYNQHAVVGCDLGPSTNESVLRTTSEVRRINVLYSTLTSDQSKSALRFVYGSYQHAYGNKLVDGEAWLGEVTSGGFVNILRFEANYLTGTTSVGGAFMIRDDLHDATICNNVIQPDSQTPLSIGNNPTVGLNRIKLFCNSALVATGSSSGLFTGGGTGTNIRFSGNEVRANLCVIDNPGNRSQGALFFNISDLVAVTYTDNVVPPLNTTSQDYFARLGIAGVTTGISNLAAWNLLPFVGTDYEVNTSLNDKFKPAPATGVTTPAGVYDDYYGAPRDTNSSAGAVQ